MNVHHLLKWILNFQLEKQNIKKILEKWQKILEKSGKSQGIMSVRKSGNPETISIENILLIFC